jgi:hypothetical protein
MIDRLQKAFDAQLTELGKILTNGSQRWLEKGAGRHVAEASYRNLIRNIDPVLINARIAPKAIRSEPARTALNLPQESLNNFDAR